MRFHNFTSNRLVPTERRRSARTPVDLFGKLVAADARLSVRVIDLSLGGMRVQMPFPVTHYGPLQIQGVTIDDAGFIAARPRWISDRIIGLELTNPVAAAAVTVPIFTRLRQARAPVAAVTPTGG